MEVKVSVIIPCYNYAHYLEQSLKSLQAQSLQQWECFVVDDGSTDSTATVARQFAAHDSRIRYIHQLNQGQPVARNTGLARACGAYLQFLDADDLLEPHKLREQCQYLDANPETGLVYGDVRYFTNEQPGALLLNRWGDQHQEWMPRLSGKGTPVVSACIEQNPFELGCALFRRSALPETLRFRRELQGVEDYAYCLEAAIGGVHFEYLGKPHARVLMRHHTGSFSKGLTKMYKKEIELRSAFREKLRSAGYGGLAKLNSARYAWRLRKLQDHIIDQTIKGNHENLNLTELKWLLFHSSVVQNFYFFPRVIKGMLLNKPSNAR